MIITLYGDPRTKKNSQRPIKIKKKDGKSFTKLLPSTAYEAYEADCLKQITGDKKISITRPVNVKCLYYMKTRRVVDLVNLLEATDDILVAAEVLDDDNIRIVVGHDGSRVLYDKANPRVEVEITEVQHEDHQTIIPGL